MSNKKKSELRKYFMDIRKNISDIHKEQQSKKICKKLEIYINNKEKQLIVALFAGTKNEPNLGILLETENKNIIFCFPKVINKKLGIMNFYQVDKISDLEFGFANILEPKKQCKKIGIEKINIFCIPAVSIDSENNRIGMGGGFYDRVLAQNKNAEKIGIIFSEQKYDGVFESEKWDIAMDSIL